LRKSGSYEKTAVDQRIEQYIRRTGSSFTTKSLQARPALLKAGDGRQRELARGQGASRNSEARAARTFDLKIS
jgi:hypothetical protein